MNDDDLERILKHFRSIATHRVVYPNGYCPRLPNPHEVEAVADYLAHIGETGSAGVLRREHDAMNHALFGPMPWGNHPQDRQSQFESAVERIVRLLETMKRLTTLRNRREKTTKERANDWVAKYLDHNRQDYERLKNEILSSDSDARDGEASSQGISRGLRTA